VSGVRLWVVYIGTLAGRGEEERKYILVSANDEGA